MALPAPLQELWTAWGDIQGNANHPVMVNIVGPAGEYRDGLRQLLLAHGGKAGCVRTVESSTEVPPAADIHLLDFHLDGGRTGLEVLDQLQARHGPVAAVIVTADRDGELRQRLLERGVGLLYKPLKPLALRQVLQRVAKGAVAAG